MENNNNVQSNWTTDQLRQLKEQTNHAINYDGWNYHWYHYIDGEWSLHAIKDFEDFEKPYSWMRYWLSKYNNEYNKRLDILMKRLLKTTLISKKIEIVEELKPNLTNTEMASYLRVSVKTIQRNRK